METTNKILLNDSVNKKNVNENMSLNVNLYGNRKLLPEDGITDSLDSYDVFLDERKSSNKFRLILTIYPYCSNVLFNPFTEIVKYEGSKDVKVLNYESPMTTSQLESYIGNPGCIIGKKHDTSFKWNVTQRREKSVPSNYEAIRDTQLSNAICGFDYHCGIDIFNNHIMRKKTFKAVNYNENNSPKSVGNFGEAYKNGNYRDVLVNELGIPHVYIDGDFNTIDDYMRDRDGHIVSQHFPKIMEGGFSHQRTRIPDGTEAIIERTIFPLHLYQGYDIFSFNEAIKERLLDDNGWYGFSNQSTTNTIKLIDVDNGGSISAVGDESDINKTINNRIYCDYIDLYPGRNLFSFTPIYNSFRKRLEKNWNYCLTYPSESITSIPGGGEFPFFRTDSNGNISLKVYMFDEGTKDDDETDLLTVYSVCQHGLKEGDTVNIYKGNELFYESTEVYKIVDKYVFQVIKDSGNMSDMWVEVEDRTAQGTRIANPVGTNDYISGKTSGGVYVTNGKRYPICESNRCNIDPNAQDIHFRRVVNDVECEYYVRKFSRLPNFKFKDEEVNEYSLYDDKYKEKVGTNRRKNENRIPLIKRFSNPTDSNSDFENHISKVGFSNTAYNDDVTQIVYTDDIDISYLKDNLGRPLSDIFLTIVKNNKGYREWYGIGKSLQPESDLVEYSHCFGKVNSSFLLSDYFRENVDNSLAIQDVRDITATNKKGIKMFTSTNNVSGDIVKTNSSNDADEIDFDNTWSYYGDICCYSPLDCDEQIIQTSMNRFNTVQRELFNLNGKALEYYNKGVIVYDEIKDTEHNLIYSNSGGGDPYNLFKNRTLKHTKQVAVGNSLNNLMTAEEGYYYQAHYRIPLKTVSKSVKSDKAIEYEIEDVKNTGNSIGGRKIFEFKTKYENDFVRNDKSVLYKRSTNEYFYLSVYEISSSTRFTCVINDEDFKTVSSIQGLLNKDNIDDYVIIKKSEGVPSYARLVKDGSCRYYWREILSNGIEDDSKVYPFTNGAFYVTQQINFFLRRQDPKKENLGDNEMDIPDIKDKFDYVPDGEDINNYPNFIPDDKTNYEETEIETC